MSHTVLLFTLTYLVASELYKNNFIVKVWTKYQKLLHIFLFIRPAYLFQLKDFILVHLSLNVGRYAECFSRPRGGTGPRLGDCYFRSAFRYPATEIKVISGVWILTVYGIRSVMNAPAGCWEQNGRCWKGILIISFIESPRFSQSEYTKIDFLGLALVDVNLHNS